jgi:hypothetical protein
MKRAIILMAVGSLGVPLIGVLIGVLGYAQVSRVIVGGWFGLGMVLWIFAELWLWRVRVLQRRARRESFPRARAWSVR